MQRFDPEKEEFEDIPDLTVMKYIFRQKISLTLFAKTDVCERGRRVRRSSGHLNLLLGMFHLKNVEYAARICRLNL